MLLLSTGERRRHPGRRKVGNGLAEPTLAQSDGDASWRVLIRRIALPVVLTALAAILGMIPLARSIFWGPMAITMMGGLFVATILTLLVVPALYSLWFRVRSDETLDTITADPEPMVHVDRLAVMRIAAE